MRDNTDRAAGYAHFGGAGIFREEALEHRSNRLQGEVVLTQPLSTAVLSIVLFLFVVGLAIWAALSTYARIETAPGLLVTEQPSAKVIAPVAGIVTRLLVQEGSVVSKGQRLAVIGLDRKDETGAGFAGEGLVAIDARIGISDSQIGMVSQRIANERVKLGEAARSAIEQSASLEEQIKLQKDIVASNSALLHQIATVVEKGFVSKVEFERRRQVVLNSQQALRSLEQQLVSRKSEATQAQNQLATLALQATREKSEVLATSQALQQQRAQLRGEKSYVITAPVAGRVTALQTAEGRTASNELPLMILVPMDTTVRAEIFAPSRAIGFVHVGQETRLLYDAYPYQRFGSFRGTIVSVSRTIIDPRESDVPIKLDEGVYKITVVLERQALQAYGQTVSLQPGMTLKANIVLERQSFVDWMLAPLNAVMNRLT